MSSDNSPLYTDLEGNYYAEEPVTANAPVRAYPHVCLNVAAKLFRTSKAVGVRGACLASQLPHGIHPDAGFQFTAWVRLRHGDAVCLFDPAAFSGAVSSSVDAYGLRGRFLEIKLFGKWAPASIIGRFGPQGDLYEQIFAEPKIGAFYTGDGNGDPHLTFGSESDWTLRVQAYTDGTLGAQYLDHEHSSENKYSLSAVIQIDASPLFPWTTLNPPPF